MAKSVGEVAKKLTVYVGLIGIVSLLKFHLDWWDEFRIRKEVFREAVRIALVPGSLFFFSMTLSMSLFAELGDNPKIAKRAAVFVLRGLCWVSPVVLLFMYVQVRYGALSPDAFYYNSQLAAAILSFFVAVVGKAHIYRLK